MLKDLVIRNRSYRGYDESAEIPEEVLRELVDTARLVASGANIQPLKYHIACAEEEVHALNSLTNWAMALKHTHLPYEGQYPTAYIVMYIDESIPRNPKFDVVEMDVGIAAQTILLAATEQGLGGCMIGNFNKRRLREALEPREDLNPVLILAIGKPVEDIEIVDIGEDGNTTYYRDENNRHYVPKRALEDILV